MSIILCFCCGFFCALAELAATAENVPTLASAKKTPVSTTKNPIKTRRLKKADREDFCFMELLRWMEFKCEAQLVAELPLARQHFSGLCVVAVGVYGTVKI